MGSKNAKIPDPPPLPAEVSNFMGAQGLSLQQMSNLLSEGQIGLEETQKILKGASGLYKTENYTNPEVRKTSWVKDPNKTTIIHNKLLDAGTNGNSSLYGATARQIIDNPALLKDLQARGLDPDAPLTKYRGNGARIFVEHVTDNQNIENAPGLYGWGTEQTSVVTPAESGTRQVLDEGAYKKWKDAIGENVAFENEIGTQARQGIVDWLNREPTEYEKQQEEIGLLQSERQLKALKGELPLSSASQQQKLQEFNLLRENAARSGNIIQGDTPESAIGLSSSANEAVEAFNSKWGLVEEAEKRGELTSGEAATLSRYGLTSDIGARDLNTSIGLSSQYTPGSTQMGLLGSINNYSPTSLLSGYGALNSGYSNAMSPYMSQYQMGYNALVGNAGLRSQNQAAGYGLLGTAGGMGLGSGNPWGMGIGAGLVGAGYLMSR